MPHAALIDILPPQGFDAWALQQAIEAALTEADVGEVIGFAPVDGGGSMIVVDAPDVDQALPVIRQVLRVQEVPRTTRLVLNEKDGTGGRTQTEVPLDG